MKFSPIKIRPTFLNTNCLHPAAANLKQNMLFLVILLVVVIIMGIVTVAAGAAADNADKRARKGKKKYKYSRRTEDEALPKYSP